TPAGAFTKGTDPTITQTVRTVAREAYNGGTVLFVGGTAAGSHIQVKPAGTQVTVDLHDGTAPATTPLAGLTGLVVYGQAANEHIEVDHALTLPEFLFGGNGNNVHVQAGGGPAVEVGGAGANTHLEGGDGPGILIAG